MQSPLEYTLAIDSLSALRRLLIKYETRNIVIQGRQLASRLAGNAPITSCQLLRLSVRSI